MAKKKKVIKIVVICLVFAALLAGLITLMVMPQDYGNPDKLGVGSPDSNFGTRLWIGVQVAIMGLGTVFLMLALLILMVTVMKYIFIGAGKLKEKQTAKKSQAVVVEQGANEQTTSSEEEEEIVAVIMAALNAYYESQEPTYVSNLKFKVRSIKEIK